MYQVDISPETARVLEHIIRRQLESGNEESAVALLEMFEKGMAKLAEAPLEGSSRLAGFPGKYRIRNIQPQISMIYQVKEDIGCVKVETIIDNQKEGSLVRKI